MTTIAPLVVLASASSCGPASDAEQLGRAATELSATGPNKPITGGCIRHYAVDPSLAWNRTSGTTPTPPLYFVAFTTTPFASKPVDRHELGWAFGIDDGTFGGGLGGGGAADAKLTWVGFYPDGSGANALPIRRPAFDRPALCSEVGAAECTWTALGPEPVAVAGGGVNAFAIVARMSTAARRNSDLVVLSNGGLLSARFDAAPATVVTTAKTFAFPWESLADSDFGPTGGLIQSFSATTSDDGKRLWIYWEEALRKRAWMRLLDWDGKQFVPNADVPEPLVAPSSEHGAAAFGERAKISVVRMIGSGAPGKLTDYRVVLSAMIGHLVFDDMTKPGRAPTTAYLDDDESCPHAPMAAQLRLRLAVGDVLAGVRSYWRMSGPLSEASAVPYCIASGRKRFFDVGYGNEHARIHFDTAIVARGPDADTTGTKSFVDVAFVEADPPSTRVFVEETGFTRVRVKRFAIDSASSDFGWATEMSDFVDPTRPGFRDRAYATAIFDQWGPSLAQGSSAQLAMPFFDARAATFTGGFGPNNFMTNVVRAAVQPPSGPWNVDRDFSDLLSTSPPSPVPFRMQAPQGHGTAAVFGQGAADFVGVWPDSRLPPGSSACAGANDYTGLMSTRGLP